MIKLLLLLLIPLLAFFDRQRGADKKTEIIPKIVALAGLGICVSLLVGHWLDWQALVIAVTVAVGYTFGLGHPVGMALTGKDIGEYESWQVGILRSNPWLALAVRGAFIGVCSLAAIDYLAALKITLAFAVAFPLAPWIATRVFKRTGTDAWSLQETIRGGLAGAVLWLLP